MMSADERGSHVRSITPQASHAAATQNWCIAVMPWMLACSNSCLAAVLWGSNAGRCISAHKERLHEFKYEWSASLMSSKCLARG